MTSMTFRLIISFADARVINFRQNIPYLIMRGDTVRAIARTDVPRDMEYFSPYLRKIRIYII